MIQGVLDNIKQKASEILIEYTNGMVGAMLNGYRTFKSVADGSKRIVYLHGIVDNSYLVGDVVYVGGTAVSDDYINEVFHKMWSYNGVFSSVSLSDYDTVVPDDGEGGSVEVPSVPSSDDYRAGTETVSVGNALVTFKVGGVYSPLPSADYVVNAYVISVSGFRQDIVTITNKNDFGFVAEGILEEGTLYYTATIIT